MTPATSAREPKNVAPAVERAIGVPTNRHKGVQDVRRSRYAQAGPAAESARERGSGHWHDFLLPEGSYSALPAWTSREQWLTRLSIALALPEGEAIRRAVGPAAATVMRVARDDAAHADHATGRGVETAHRGIAKRLDVEVSTVRKARRIIARLGFSVTVRTGRRTSAAMRAEAREWIGRDVWRITSTRALVVPRDHAVSHPSTTSVVGRSSSVRRTHQARQRRAATRSRTTTTTRPSLRTQLVAAHLADQLSYLDRGDHIGALCKAVDAALSAFGGLDALPHCPNRPSDPENPSDKGFSPARWIARTLQKAVDGWHTAHGRSSLAHESTKPVAWFAWALRQALTPGDINRLRVDLEHASSKAAAQLHRTTNPAAAGRTA